MQLEVLQHQQESVTVIFSSLTINKFTNLQHNLHEIIIWVSSVWICKVTVTQHPVFELQGLDLGQNIGPTFLFAGTFFFLDSFKHRIRMKRIEGSGEEG